MKKTNFLKFLSYLKKFLIGLLASVGFLTLLTFTFFLFFISNRDIIVSHPDKIKGDVILTLDLDQIFRETNYIKWSEPKINLREIINAIYFAKSDDNVKALLAINNNNNMNLTQLKDLRDAIKSFKKSNKPTYLYTDTFGEFNNSTGSYYLASIFDEIWIQPSGYVGLIGLSIIQPFLSDFLKKIGVEFEVFKRENYKSAMEIFSESKISKDNKEALNKLLNSMSTQISKEIADSRNFSFDEIIKIIDNGPYFSNEAKDKGLVDKLGYRDEFDNKLSKKYKNVKKINIEDYSYLIKNNLKTSPGKTVAIIYASGQIQMDRDNTGLPSEDIISAKHLSKVIINAANNENIDAIILRVDSPGGSPIASDKIWRATNIIREKNKPFIVSMGNTAASGGYYISMAADKIFAQPTTITGSIGVLTAKPVIKDMLKDLEINIYSSKFGNNSDLFDITKKSNKQKVELINNYLDKVYYDFINKASIGRNLSIEEISKVARGRVWSGSDAIQKGLVDYYGGLREAIEYTKKTLDMKDNELIDIIILPKPIDPLEKIVETLLDGNVFQNISNTIRLINNVAYKLVNFHNNNQTSLNIQF
ncbi:MAG: signal peptide peptidase SppA [Alphaproteobacteria bacterium TMED87]|nr:signal peptide peptidase SppA [Rhodospirillaceae bacterium]OUV10686.1 MAG: signal peptide peptidase SppA [Alphaproteobacteria bacterium TMED87]